MVLLLEIARGLAAFWVLLYHTKGLFHESSLLIYHFSEYGHLGVPMFFVISGYVITYSAESSIRADKPAREFFKKRFLRIYPTFWASVLVVLLIPYILAAISMLKTGAYQMPELVLSEYSFYEWINFLALSKIFFSHNADLQAQFNAVNSVYWTLAIEMQFYIVMFLALLFKKYYKAIIIVVTLFSFVNIFVPTGLNYGLFIHYWPSFSVGIVLAYIHKRGFKIETLLPRISLAGSLIITITWLAVSATYLRSNNPDIFVFALIFGAVLWCMTPVEQVLVGIKKNTKSYFYWPLEMLLVLGAMSYTVYLLHGKVYLIPMTFARQLFPETSLIYGFSTITLTLIICFPFYLLVERRFMSKNYSNIHQKILTV